MLNFYHCLGHLFVNCKQYLLCFKFCSRKMSCWYSSKYVARGQLLEAIYYTSIFLLHIIGSGGHI
jgi:hypothetical protein